MLYLGSDHGGFSLKEELFRFCKTKKRDCIDVGTFAASSCDYPLFAQKVAGAVQKEPKHRGILICTSGIGMSIVANKFVGIYAACLTSAESVRKARQHNAINVLCLPGALSVEVAKACLQAFLTTDVDRAQRHEERRQQILTIEQQNFR